MIAYVSQEELRDFYSSNEIVIGRAYEWQGENVIHFHLKPIENSFGIEHIVTFQKENVQVKVSDGYVVSVKKIGNEICSDIYWVNADGTKIFLDVNYVPAKADLYSRSKGLLEVNVLKDKRVMIIGLGSFGSQISIELAKAGVGNFALFDFDRVELHNLARHIATVNDLGRLKTDVMEDAIKGKNPYANVDKFPININEHIDILESEVEKCDIVICATDNNESRFHISNVLVQKHKIGIFGRAVTRAEGGDVFRYIPGGPCYCCLIGNEWFGNVSEEITNVESARKNGQIAAYVSEQDADALVQVGLSSDIEPMCNMMIKLALVELSRGTQSGIACLEDELVFPYYMWANRRERRHKNWAAMPTAGNLPTIMRWYGADIKRRDDCVLCSNKSVSLDLGDDVNKKYGNILKDNDLSDVTIKE